VKVIGVGNRWRSDDAAGLIVADRLRGALGGVDVVECEGEPVALLATWQSEDAVVVVDAVCSGREPGTVHRLDASHAPLPADLFAASTHHLGVPDAVELARALDKLPDTCIVIGVEGALFEAGEGLSPPVEAALGAVEAAVREEVAACTNGR
jgi:hydrogenase maturation protease